MPYTSGPHNGRMSHRPSRLPVRQLDGDCLSVTVTLQGLLLESIYRFSRYWDDSAVRTLPFRLVKFANIYSVLQARIDSIQRKVRTKL